MQRVNFENTSSYLSGSLLKTKKYQWNVVVEETLKALWPELNHTDVTILATQMQEKTYEKNQVIFKEGDRDGHFYLILEGQVEVTKEVTPTPSEQQQSPEPEQVSLVTLHAGDVAGESGLVRIFTFFSFDIADRLMCRLT